MGREKLASRSARGGLKVDKKNMYKGTYDLSNLPVAAHPDWSKDNNGIATL